MQEYLRKLKAINYRSVLEIQFEVRPRLQGVPYWTAGFLVGVIAVLYSGAFSFCISAAQRLFDTHPYWLFVTSPACFIVATWLVDRFAPAAGGTGVPQVLTALQMAIKRAQEVMAEEAKKLTGGVKIPGLM